MLTGWKRTPDIAPKWADVYTELGKKHKTKVRKSGISPFNSFFGAWRVDLESQYVYLANCMHDLAPNTELGSENHKMKVVLTPKFRHLSPKRNNTEPKKQTIKILNRPIFCNGI